MKLIKTEDAVGHVLCHDITRIIPGKEKGPVFRKGHIVTEEDIPMLLSIGKETLYIYESNEGMLHENEAAQILYEICASEFIHGSDIKEGKIELISDIDGLLKVDSEKLNKINSLGEMMIATRHGGFPVKAGDKLAGTRIIPLVIEKEKMEEASKIAPDGGLLNVMPFKNKKAGVVTTGSEIYKGRIEDAFTPVIADKLMEYGVPVTEHEICDDSHEMITSAINKMLRKGLDLILCTGGMSVDPDDRTPLAIKNTGARIVTYGAPTLPGAMFLLSYHGANNIPIAGLPGCVMYAKRTIFDIVLPHLIADDMLTKRDIDMLGEGGLCLNCEVCTYPNCGFGK